MGFFDGFKRRNPPRDKDKAKLIPYSVNTWNYRYFDGSMLKSDLVKACVDALSRNIAKMHLQAVVVNRDGTREVDYASDVARVLQHPNRYMTTYDFLYKVSSMYWINNNAFIYPEYDEKGNLIAIHPIMYENFHLLRTENGVLIAQFQLNYWRTYTIPYEQIIHLRNHYMRDDLMGDTNEAITPVMELLNAQNQGIVNGIKNSAMIRGILKAVNVIKQEDMNRARDQFVEDNLRASNNGGVIGIDGKFEYQNLESKPYIIDSDTMEETKKMVFNYFGVNEAFLENTFSSDGYEAIYEGRLEPFAIMLTQALTHGLYTERERGFGNEIEANMSKLKYQPMTVVTAMISATRELGLFTRDEYREMLGYTPLGKDRGGDEIMIAVNNYESQQEVKPDGNEE